MTLPTVRCRLVQVSTAPGVGWCRLLTNGTAASEQTTSRRAVRWSCSAIRHIQP